MGPTLGRPCVSELPQHKTFSPLAKVFDQLGKQELPEGYAGSRPRLQARGWGWLLRVCRGLRHSQPPAVGTRGATAALCLKILGALGKLGSPYSCNPLPWPALVVEFWEVLRTTWSGIWAGNVQCGEAHLPGLAARWVLLVGPLPRFDESAPLRSPMPRLASTLSHPSRSVLCPHQAPAWQGCPGGDMVLLATGPCFIIYSFRYVVTRPPFVLLSQPTNVTAWKRGWGRWWKVWSGTCLGRRSFCLLLCFPSDF